MRTRSKLLFAGLTAAIVLSAAVGSASANRLSVSEPRFRATWTALRLTAAEATIECPVTLEGSFHSATIRKVVGALVGHVSRASVRGSTGAGNCTNGSATIFQESLPWHLQYLGFTGTLPRPTAVRLWLVGARFRVDPSGALPPCNATTTRENPAVGDILTEANGLVTGLRALREFEIPLESGLCPFGGDGRFEGTGSVTRLGSAGNISIRLI